MPDTTETLNNRLAELYAGCWTVLGEIFEPEVDPIAVSGISTPLFLHVFEDYAAARKRLLIVGQQTYGWVGQLKHEQFMSERSAQVERLVSVYRKFDRGRKYRSPFWSAAKYISKRLNGKPGHGLLWSNLFRVDQRKSRPNKKVESWLAKTDYVLREEVAILEPSVVVFFTGPNYDSLVRRIFDGVRFDSVAGKGKRSISRLEHTLLPHHSYRVYHPAYLRRSKQWPLLDTLANACLDE